MDFQKVTTGVTAEAVVGTRAVVGGGAAPNGGEMT